MMKAVIFDKPGGPEVLHLGERPVPDLPPAHLLMRVAYTALNRADTLQRLGLYPPPAGASDVLGLEFSGHVHKVGEGCTQEWKEGERVAGLVGGGSYAEFVVVEEPLVLRLPPTFPLQLAASIPEAWLTAHQLLFFVAHVKPGQRVLIHAGASGVGLAAIQLAREAGALPYATASADKHRFTQQAGAEASIDYKPGPWLEPLRQATGGQPIDVVIDCVGASYYAQNVEALGMDGVYVLYGSLGGFRTEVDLRVLMRKRITIAASTLRARSLDYKESLVKALWTAERVGKFQDGRLISTVHTVMDWSRAAEAHALMESNANAGKIVLAVDPSLE